MADSVTNPQRYLDHLRAEHGLAVSEVPEVCVIAHVRSVVEGALQRFPVETLDIGAQRNAPVYLFRPHEGPAFGMVFGVQGAPMAAATLEELTALGFRHFWCVGTAGHPVHGAPTLKVGDLVLVDRALVYEGTSPHYDNGTHADPDPEMFDLLGGVLHVRGLPYTVGTVATTDALYRETPGFLREVVSRGAVAIDMELSALFTVSRFHGTQMGALLVVSDLVSSEGTWTLEFASERLRESEQTLLEVLLDCLGVR